MYRKYIKRVCNYNSNMNNDARCNNDDNDNEYMETSCQYVDNNEYYNDCECGFDEENTFPANPMFGQSYVPFQVMNKTFIPSVGLKMGTIFPELVSPYMPGQSEAENNYIAENNNIKGGCNK